MRCSDAEPPIRKSHSLSRSCLSLLLVWTLICGTAAPRVHAAGNWLIELSSALLSTPNTQQLDTPTDAVISRTRPTLNSGRIKGNLRVIKPEPFSMGAQTNVVGDLFLAGSPSIQSNQAEVIDEGGPASSSYVLSIRGVSGKIQTHTKPITLPADFPSSVPASTGIRTNTIRTKSDVAAIGDWQTVRDLNVTRAGLSIDVPPGNYGTFTVNGNSRLNFTAGTYNFANTFNLDGSATLQRPQNTMIATELRPKRHPFVLSPKPKAAVWTRALNVGRKHSASEWSAQTAATFRLLKWKQCLREMLKILLQHFWSIY